jgi:D-alanine-D-alanine ligase
MTDGTNDGSRLRVAVLFGGRSAEHDVSIMSATNAVRALDPEKYDVLPVFVTRDGIWLESCFEGGELARPDDGARLSLLPGGRGRIVAVGGDGAARELPAVDVLFPVLHGPHGEDGSVQGLAEVAGVALAGCGILGSATAIDKDIAKRLMNEAGVPTAPAVVIHAGEVPRFADLQRQLGLPIFVKPARQGSSVGVSKVATEAQFEAALKEGFRHDRKLLAETFVAGREVECSVLEAPDGTLFVSRTGEIAPASSHGFYTYDAKYVDADGAAIRVPADLPKDVENAVRETAAKAFRALSCDAMARVDFFLKPDMSFLVNELNTIPGFTDISMYAKAMAASGVSYAEVIDRLISHGLARAGR